MDYSKLTYFSVKYSEFSQYYKDKLYTFLNDSFHLPSYELYDFSIITGFMLDNEIVGTLSILKTIDLKSVLAKNNNDEMTGYSKKGEGGLFIYNVLVKDDLQRNKLGEVLINLCLINNPTEKYLHAQVKKENEPSYNLFFKTGFQIEDEMQDDDNNHVCLMSRII
jgi:ribosomal protein S18 acetylase RimI-like enzyme